MVRLGVESSCSQDVSQEACVHVSAQYQNANRAGRFLQPEGIVLQKTTRRVAAVLIGVELSGAAPFTTLVKGTGFAYPEQPSP
jgi:hypothetical protein